ncbi:hypothetical protein B5C34_02455 [Pacificimonas flava]|uniref:Pilus assembly protein CpaD n=2 Tax=Pacificimonas TaxID=1960290 RepID=A0A219B2L9_9SPHN|nr:MULTISPECIES: CpaD family pilus assembly lipoprotein [Pacificimonas]MBZ6377918.1 hypothetical protein [Pacificimonas aurantium]OWV32424.1 hypothetical protein B5C34_02455 [Pacificimonas flava]
MNVLPAATVLALVGVMIAACAPQQQTPEFNQTNFPLNTPVVEQHVMTYDLVAPAGTGLTAAQRDELREWLNSVGARYGDRISVDQEAVLAAPERRAQVETIVNERGLVLQRIAPVTSPAIPAGATRVVLVRAEASVPDCPNHSGVDDTNYDNATSSNFGCATSTALTQMIADPNDLLSGKTYEEERQVIIPETGPAAALDD